MDAGRREFNRLKNEAVETGTREDRLKQLKAKVEEAERQAARETYERIKAEEVSSAEGNVEEEEALDARQKSDVEAAGAAAALREHARSKGVDEVVEGKEKEEVEEVGRSSALAEYKRIRTEEH